MESLRNHRSHECIEWVNVYVHCPRCGYAWEECVPSVDLLLGAPITCPRCKAKWDLVDELELVPGFFARPLHWPTKREGGEKGGEEGK